ncbi:lipopolysaccharide-induced tumor necrosis factor-alpha factor homolog [Cololabis saira]|uniref:lipopolysaccharide-induced tumor necrosis factor-alpha factor homolog n=1 Tax=Cololabis saira TaxID=129043 RepID=UPI002AD3CADE|nr:lipopolysaccharide-induced tumor necrosis factor-alpha factor homolog [Cololabis saira]XP_061586972.1 lipopolysaccharide-induced tumor necrosis factor-alpha factor homolog [Cololabis saira]
MEPPSYEEASHHPPAHGTEGFNCVAPPAYDNSLFSPSTPPPAYGEAIQPDLFPILTTPTVPTVVIPPPYNSGVTVHPLTQVGVGVNSRQAQTVVVVSQPQPVAISVQALRDAPGLVRCPHCRHLVTSKVTYSPGTAAWCACIFIALMGLICGFCLIPLMLRGLQDVHHSCPHCGRHLHVYTK